MRGRFIVFEGGDGAGKTTQVTLLREWLEGRGHTVVQTREPGGTPLGQQLRELLLHGDAVDPRAEALLYAADRAHHVAEVVRPALAAGSIVLQDRYIDSSVAYQGAGRVLGADDVANLSRWATHGLTPDVTVLLDIDPRIAAERRQRRDGDAPDRLEREALDFHLAVRDGFLAQAARHSERYLVLDAGQRSDRLAEQIRERVAPLLAASKH